METMIDSRQIGDWTYRSEINSLTYDVTEHYEYVIPLDEVYNATDILNWIAQVNDKTWATPQVVGELVEAFRVVRGVLHHKRGATS